ncbi:hypothetical protein B0A52_09084 [Exophiala mesophila]|uniref:Dol-P-Man:Man(5)GlcNAc(2)-PP-Dol alpha-1,3-mannosyltransferase n=1 Tax=Exophiala mesophila TaxID=212818 RepID=A0A438MVQ2_EXOME|nr:hypothetical protein B0A52_09084 [Exophiala mesophila]
MSNLASTIQDLSSNPKHTRWIGPLIIVGEAVLCALIIWKVPYTEIDWSTYMTQVHTFLNGERNYAKITGPTGPLVYPGLHVFLYTLLCRLTDAGENIFKAQVIFAGLYLVTLAIVIACYRRVGAPPWLLVPLALSKRLHSIFLLRLFNDAWVTLAFWATIYFLQRRRWQDAAIAWSCGLTIKMTMLLTAPALAVILLQAQGIVGAIFSGVSILVIGYFVSAPFVATDYQAYFARAFDFGRQFLFKWTVNWRFVDEATFLSKGFAISLLIVHVSLLVVFIQLKWTKPAASNPPDFFKRYLGISNSTDRELISKRITPTFVMDTMTASMVIGLLCARSLHYQFFAYLGWTSPYILWRFGGSPSVVLWHVPSLLLQSTIFGHLRGM